MHLGNYLLVARAPLALGQGYLGPCLGVFILDLALCWQKEPQASPNQQLGTHLPGAGTLLSQPHPCLAQTQGTV